MMPYLLKLNSIPKGNWSMQTQTTHTYQRHRNLHRMHCLQK
jgi:hypothetical protein